MRRKGYLSLIAKSFQTNPIVALLGPRQCGKTRLAQDFSKGKKVHYFDLEDPRHLAQFQTPLLALEDLKGWIVIDEIQRTPELFPILRVLVDRTQRKVKYLILGSASRDLIRQSSESLAGRLSHIQLTPFTAREVGARHLNRLWMRGGFPLSFLSKSPEQSARWRRDYISTFLERDIPNLGFQMPPATLRRFWMMLAHYHGQVFNASEIGKSLGLSHTTIRKYLDILTGTFMVRQLHPWIENLGKRQVKSPKIYFRDSGLFHTLLECETEEQMRVHPKRGASWEGFALEEIIRMNQLRENDVYFWATHNEAELDLFFIKKGKRIGYEIKFTDSPKITKSMKIAMTDLKLDQLFVVYPGRESFPLAPRIKAVGLAQLPLS